MISSVCFHEESLQHGFLYYDDIFADFTFSLLHYVEYSVLLWFHVEKDSSTTNYGTEVEHFNQGGTQRRLQESSN